MEIKFERAAAEDAETLIDVRNKSFYEDYIRYGMCPGYNISKEHMIDSISSTIAYKIVCNNQVIGNIGIKDNQDSNYYIGCLCVIPDYQNKGIGQKAINFVENEFPNAVVWILKTPADKERNIYFYKKMGYKIIDEFVEGSVKLVVFEKKINAI
ncbi:GNAT family N-acetyltransferase [Clostridium oryzae]|uniref:Putative acetyltransferase n=1 Tax=Clostridium oryzae TaxID=1450648 RepID=A0A1V4IUT5_9CLOT|nr:GNAT family N-acetyltransferase [Clostridium oryzae]OPJ63801.1 putative acetyltransferase [Clostridium oryzae]